MSDTLDFERHNAHVLAKIMFTTTYAHDIEQRVGDYIYESTLERKRLEEKNAQLLKGFRLIREELKEESHMSKHLTSIDHICITALSNEEGEK